MARRKKTNPTAAAPESAHRAATPRRSLVALSPHTGAAASVLATGAVLGISAGGLAPGVSAAAATAVVGAFGAKVGGRTLGEWISLKRNASDLPEQAALFDRDGVGIIHDGRTVSACVEITPRPWQLTTITGSGASEAPTISADQLRRQLVQYDIHCSRLTAICAGYKFAARDNAAGVLDTLIGPVSAPLGGTTVIVVSIDIEADVLGPAYRRAPKSRTSGEPSLPDGLCRTITLAATRVSHSLAENGFGGRLMNAPKVRAFHDGVLGQIAAPLSDPHWTTCGSPNGVHTRTYSPARGYWNAEAAGAWNHLQSHRQFTTLTLTPKDDTKALVQPLITYLVNGDDALARAVGYGLLPASGQQVTGLAQALPVATRMPLRTPGAVIDDDHHLGFGIPAGGAGMFVGSRADKTRVFVAVSPADDPLWICGPTLFALQMVGRLSTQDLRIAVMIDDPAWKRLVAHRNTPALKAGTLRSVPADVVVCTPQFWERNRELCSGKAVILVTEDDPGRLATNSLAVVTGADGRAQIAVNVDTQKTTVGWELTPLERRALLGAVDNDGASPVEGHTPRLSELVQLPAAPPRRKKRPSAPAPVVDTVAPLDPEALAVEVAAIAAAPPPPVKKRPVPLQTVGTDGQIEFVAPVELPASAVIRHPSPVATRVDLPSPVKEDLTAPVIEFVPPAELPLAAALEELDPWQQPVVVDTTAVVITSDEVSAPAEIQFVPQAEVPFVSDRERPRGRHRRGGEES